MTTWLRRAIQRRHAAASGDAGQTLPATILAPVIMLLIAGCLQATVWYAARVTAHASAQEGVSAARVHGGTVAAGEAAATRFARTAGSGLLLSPTCAGRRTGQTIAIRCTGTAPSFLPAFNPAVSQTARGPRERFTTPGQQP